MKEICRFIINDKVYKIYDVDKIKGKNTYVGSSNYDNGEIFIEERKFKSNAANTETRAYARLAVRKRTS